MKGNLLELLADAHLLLLLGLLLRAAGAVPFLLCSALQLLGFLLQLLHLLDLLQPPLELSHPILLALETVTARFPPRSDGPVPRDPAIGLRFKGLERRVALAGEAEEEDGVEVRKRRRDAGLTIGEGGVPAGGGSRKRAALPSTVAMAAAGRKEAVVLVLRKLTRLRKEFS